MAHTPTLLRSDAALVPTRADRRKSRSEESGDVIGCVLGGNSASPGADRRRGHPGISEQLGLLRPLHLVVLALLSSTHAGTDPAVWGIRSGEPARCAGV